MSQTVQNNAKLQKRSNYYEFASIWRQKDRKCWVTSENIQNNAILRKWSNYNELHRYDVKKIENVELRRKTFKTTQNLKSDQNTMNCFDLMTKRSKQRKTPKVIKIQWLAWIWWQNDQNNAKLRKWSNYNELHRFDVKTINNVELRRKTFKTTLNYKLQWLASIWWQNDHNNAKIRKLSNYDELHRFDYKTIKNVELLRKTLRTTQNYKNDQITMNLHRFEVETIKILTYVANSSKQRKATNAIKQRWICIEWTSIR